MCNTRLMLTEYRVAAHHGDRATQFLPAQKSRRVCVRRLQGRGPDRL